MIPRHAIEWALGAGDVHGLQLEQPSGRLLADRLTLPVGHLPHLAKAEAPHMAQALTALIEVCPRIAVRQSARPVSDVRVRTRHTVLLQPRSPVTATFQEGLKLSIASARVTPVQRRNTDREPDKAQPGALPAIGSAADDEAASAWSVEQPADEWHRPGPDAPALAGRAGSARTRPDRAVIHST